MIKLNMVLHQQSGSTHRIATPLVQKKEMTTTFFRKMSKAKLKLIG